MILRQVNFKSNTKITSMQREKIKQSKYLELDMSSGKKKSSSSDYKNITFYFTINSG